MLESFDAAWFVPSHAQPVRDIKPLVALNRAKILEIADAIERAASSGASLEEIEAAIFSRYSIDLDANQYVLVGSTIRSYLAWLCDQGRLNYTFDNYRMIYRKLIMKETIMKMQLDHRYSKQSELRDLGNKWAIVAWFLHSFCFLWQGIDNCI